MKKIAIIGHFGGNESFVDGQTIKTKNLEKLLKNKEDVLIYRVDTYLSRKSKVKLLLSTIRALIFCDYIFLLVSINGMRVYLPLLYYLNTIAKKHLYHYVIGSELLELVSQDSCLVKYLNSFDENWFEYDSGTQQLKELGVQNVKTVPNFKNIEPIIQVKTYQDNDIFNFCTFSRVAKEKGITDAINTISRLNDEQCDKIVHLDIYGPIDPSYKEEFNILLSRHSDYVSYNGVVDSNESVSILTNYYALLFPTMWSGEGFPGTIIDSFASGLPIIASDWNANSEIIQNMKHGLIYPSTSFNTLYEAVNWSINHVDKLNQMRIDCRSEFEKYMPQNVLRIIDEAIEKNVE